MFDAKWPSDPLLKLVGTNAEQIILPSNRATAAASSLQTVYDLAAKSRVGLRFNCKNLTSKCASLRFTCNRHQEYSAAEAASEELAKELVGVHESNKRDFWQTCAVKFLRGTILHLSSKAHLQGEERMTLWEVIAFLEVGLAQQSYAKSHRMGCQQHACRNLL